MELDKFLTQDEIEKVNALKYGAANGERSQSKGKRPPLPADGGPLPLAPPVEKPAPYPIAALGRILAGATEAIAAKCQCAPALVGQSVLAVAALATQRLADVMLPFGQTRPLSLYFVSPCVSGDRKSSVDTEALMPIRMHEKNLTGAYDAAHEAWRIAHAAWVAQHRQIEHRKGMDRLDREAELTALGRAPVEPIEPLLTIPEPTVEGFAKHWRRLPGALGVFSAEGGQLIGGFGFGTDHKLKTAATFSTLWDGAGLRRLRAGDAITDLRGRRLSLHVMIQAEAAAAFLTDPTLRDQGLLSRLLIAAPDTLAGTRQYKEPPEGLDAAQRRYVAVILGLLEYPAPAANISGNELTPRVIELSSEAKAVWIAFHDHVETDMAPGGLLEDLRDVGSKAAEIAARIAGVLAIVEDPTCSTVSGATMAAACELMLWYLGEALRLAGLYRQPPAVRNAVKLLEWLHGKGKVEVTLREIMQFGPGSLRGKAEAEAALSQLEDHGWLLRRDVGRGCKWSVVAKGASQ